MISHTCFTPPTGVPVEVMTQVSWKGDPPLGVWRLLPAGQADGEADDEVVPTNAVETPTPETAATIAATTSAIAHGRRLAECKSFISRTVARADYVRPSNAHRNCRFFVITCRGDYTDEVSFYPSFPVTFI